MSAPRRPTRAQQTTHRSSVAFRPCPLCGARVGELCRNPTRRQIEDGSYATQPFSGRERRCHVARGLSGLPPEARSLDAAISYLGQRSSFEPDSGCKLFLGERTPSGYGSLRVFGVKMATHRMAWLAQHGSVPGELLVLHKCDVRHCINPEHLFLGTVLENNLDMARKGRGRKSGKGLPRGVRERYGRFIACVPALKNKYLGSFSTAEEAGRAVELAYPQP